MGVSTSCGGQRATAAIRWTGVRDNRDVAYEAETPEDPWFLANCRCVANALAAMTGHASMEDARAAGGVDGLTANLLEDAILRSAPSTAEVLS